MVADSETKSKIPVPEWVNREAFVKLLTSEHKEFKAIRNFNVVPAVATGENFMTVLLRVEIRILLNDDSEKDVSYLIKLLPNSKEMQGFVKGSRVFEKELNTYNKYLPEFEQLYRDADKTVHFGAKVYPTNVFATEDEVIILEDLRPRGFKNAARQNGFDLAHTKAVLEKLAQFHAASACYFERHGAYPAIYDRCLCIDVDGFGDFRNNINKLVFECLKLCDATYMTDTLKQYASEIPDMFQKPASNDGNEFLVLNHGDAWANNIMFQYDSTGEISETFLVDLQLNRYGSPAQDLYYLLLSSVSLDLKISHFDYFVRFYHTKLIENLEVLCYPKKLPTLKDLQLSLFKNSDWVYTVVTSVMPIVLLNQNDNANIDNLLSENETGQDLKKSMYSSPRYVEHMRQILPWAYNRGFFVYEG